MCEGAERRERVLFIGAEFSIPLHLRIRQPGPRVRVLGVCGRVYVCTQAFIGFLAFELLVNNASSATLAFSLRLVHMLQTREKQTRRWAALSKHQHACVRLGMQCMQDLMLCVWPDHACLSLGQEACSVHKQGDATAGSGIRVGAGYCK